MKVHENQPLGFLPSMKVCGVLIQHGEKFLLLKRHPQKSYGQHWNLPAGKLESGETPLQAALREVREESGIHLKEINVSPLGVLYFTGKEISFEFHLYFCDLYDEPDLILSAEETIEGKWWHWQDQIDPLIPGGTEVLNFCKRQIASKRLGEAIEGISDLAC